MVATGSERIRAVGPVAVSLGSIVLALIAVVRIATGLDPGPTMAEYASAPWVFVSGFLAAAVSFGRGGRAPHMLAWFLALLALGLACPLATFLGSARYLLVIMTSLVGFTVLARFVALHPTRLTSGSLAATFEGRGRLNRIGHRVAVLLTQPRLLWFLPLLSGVILGVAVVLITTVEVPTSTAITVFLALGWLAIAPWAVIVLAILFGLVAQYRGASPMERRQLLWAILGIQLLCVLGLFELVYGALAPPWWLLSPYHKWTSVLVNTIGYAGLFGGLAASVLYYGALDPAFLINRTTVITVGGGVALVLFKAVDTAISEWLEQWVAFPGFGSALAAGLITTGAMAAGRKLLKRLAAGVPRVSLSESAPVGDSS